MPNIRARIVQISDLHMNRKVNRGLMDMLTQVVAKQKPDILIVSGDLANQPVPWQMRRAAKFVRELKEECVKQHPLLEMIVIPGNHDFKVSGNVGLRRLTRVPFEVYFRRDGLDHGFPWRCWQAFKLRFQALGWWTSAMREDLIYRRFDELGLALFAINSNTLTEMMAAGKVESGDLQQLYAKVNENANDPAFAFLYKIAIVHHHPAPIADAPFDALSRLEDSFMIFYNAGLFVRELSRRGFNLIVHGHKHVAGYLRIVCEFPDIGRTELPIAAAGSATHPHPDDTRGNHFNFIEIYDDDTAQLTSWFFSADVEKKQETITYPLATLADVRQRRHVAFCAIQKFACREVIKTVEITNGGYSNVVIHVCGCRVSDSKGLQSVPLSLTATRPVYIRGVATDGSSQFVTLKPTQDDLYAYKGTIDLGHLRKREEGPFDYGYRYRVMNAHALSAQEFPRHYWGQKTDSEYASITCDGACDQFTLRVQFPPKFDLTTVEFDAVAAYVAAPLKGIDDDRLDRGDCSPHDEETSRIRGYLKIEQNEAILICPDPMPGMIYKILWKFRGLTKVNQNLRDTELVETTKKKLLGLADSAITSAAGMQLWNRAKTVLDRLVAEINGALKAGPEPLGVNVMVFDEQKQNLRFVCSNSDPHDLPGGDFISGEGCAGFAFEKLRCVLYHPKLDTLGFFIRSSERPTDGLGADPAVMASFPWTYGKDQLVVGVLNVSSIAPASKLLDLFDENVQAQGIVDKIQDAVARSADKLFTI